MIHMEQAGLIPLHSVTHMESPIALATRGGGMPDIHREARHQTAVRQELGLVPTTPHPIQAVGGLMEALLSLEEITTDHPQIRTETG